MEEENSIQPARSKEILYDLIEDLPDDLYLADNPFQEDLPASITVDLKTAQMEKAILLALPYIEFLMEAKQVKPFSQADQSILRRSLPFVHEFIAEVAREITSKYNSGEK